MFLLGVASAAPEDAGLPGLAGGLCLLVWIVRRSAAIGAAPASASAVTPPDCAAVQGLEQLDQRMRRQLGHAVDLSGTASLRMIGQVNGLRQSSGQLMNYLDTARVQSVQMQDEIERNGSIVAELAAFVQQLPQQIEQERRYLEQLVSEVRGLSAITDTIRGMARQTEILAINAAIAAAQAGEAGRAFAVLAGEVRRLALQSSTAAESIGQSIHQLVETVQRRSQGDFAQQMVHNEHESARLLALTDKLDEGYLDMRQFYAMLLTAITEHNVALDRDIGELLDAAQYHDVFKQIVDRLNPFFDRRHDLLAELVGQLRRGARDTAAVEARALQLAHEYAEAEAAHGDGGPAAAGGANPSLPRIELF
ncbi:methyl-accepting chemotaxis protein [Sphaerotilus hippei]|uniref:Methyl-accepting chemotaxis protein n=2 Tax=Sphaerotilus hippei TaxID=744406 RepID=A0A318GX83_9BURK|nr:methyl-accepting chemotaxis protein [Sphaerotilus hippei]